MKTPTEPSRPGLSPTVPMPRIRAVPAPASEVVEETSSEGETWVSWRISLAPEFWRISAVTAETASGTSESASLRRVAVMTMSLVSWNVSTSTVLSSTAAPSAVAPCVASAAPSSVSVSWAYAGAESAIRPADIIHTDLRIYSLP